MSISYLLSAMSVSVQCIVFMPAQFMPLLFIVVSCLRLQSLIVPVFEFVTNTVEKFPADKKELMEMWKKQKIIKPFQ